MNKITSAGKNDFNSLENDEINIKLILNFFFRNKFLIGSISLIFFVISVFYSLFQKKIWEGQFQIVLNPNQEQSSLSIVDPSIQDFLGGSQQKDLNTEVGILESPSLLMPIFESLILNKNKISREKEITFINWEKNLDINLEKGTSILNISYRDTDKEIIIPVLKKMTLAYQNYSGKSKKRRQELTKGYLKKQIAFYKQKSSESLEIAQNYATDQDLVYINMAVSSPLKMNNFEDEDYLDSNNFVFSPSIDIENIRVKASNDIREINAKIKKIEELGNNTQKLEYISSTIPALVEEGLPSELTELERSLIEMRSKYTDLDPGIKRMLEKKKLLIDFLKERSIGFLKAQKVEAEARMEAAMRPKGVLLNYKKFLRDASRDEKTLISLENQLRVTELEEARLEDPWELITNPTLLKKPVGPKKLNFALIGLLSGFLFGSGGAFLKEKRSGIVYESEEFDRLFNFEFFETFALSELNSDSEKIVFIKNFISSQKAKKINFFSLDIDNNKSMLDLKKLLYQGNEKDLEINLINGIKELNGLKNGEPLIFFSRLGSAKYNKIQTFRKYIDTFKIKLTGLILLESND